MLRDSCLKTGVLNVSNGVLLALYSVRMFESSAASKHRLTKLSICLASFTSLILHGRVILENKDGSNRILWFLAQFIHRICKVLWRKYLFTTDMQMRHFKYAHFGDGKRTWVIKALIDPKFQSSLFSELPDFFAYSERTSL